MCYYCGECTATCPRQADPGEFMAAARRYAIARYDRLGLARLLSTSGTFTVLFLALLAVALGLFLYAFHGPMPRDSLRLFAFIPAEVIHTLGVTAGVIVILMAMSGVIRMMAHIGKETVARRAFVSTGWLRCGRPSEKCSDNSATGETAKPTGRCNPGTSKSGSFMRRCCGASWGCSWPPRWTTSSYCWASSRRERGYLSGIRPVCWVHSREPCWCTVLRWPSSSDAENGRSSHLFDAVGLGFPGSPVAGRDERFRAGSGYLPATALWLELLDVVGPPGGRPGITCAVALYQICACLLSHDGALCSCSQTCIRNRRRRCRACEISESLPVRMPADENHNILLKEDLPCLRK